MARRNQWAHRLGYLCMALLAVVVTGCVSSHLGGTISGLTADGLVLANGTDTVSPAANATTFAFPALVQQGAPYNVVVQTQPAGLVCSVANGAGTMGATPVTNVEVTCIPSATPYTIHDTYDALDRSGGFVASVSSVNGGEIASLVHVLKPSAVTKLAWSGYINAAGLANGKASFVVRIYKAAGGQPSAEKVYEETISAAATKAQTAYEGFYTFSYSLSKTVSLATGDYFLAILDPETQNLKFGWEVEVGRTGTIYGSGGAFRTSSSAAWQPMNEGVTIYTGRGNSLRVEGIPL